MPDSDDSSFREATEDLSLQPVISLPPPTKLELTGEIGMKFKQWKSRWNNYVIATQLDKCSAQRRCAIMLSCIGEEALTIIDGLDLEDDDRKDPDKILDKLKEYCVGTLNEIYERYIFNSRNQEVGETFDTFLSSLRTLAKSCNYGPLRDSLIRDRIVMGIRDEPTRKRLLHDEKLTLDTCIRMCRAYESTDEKLKKLNATTEQGGGPQVHAVYKRPPASRAGSADTGSTTDRYQHRHGRADYDLVCNYCGNKHARSARQCPAWGRECRLCGESNYFAAMSPADGASTSQ